MKKTNKPAAELIGKRSFEDLQDLGAHFIAQEIAITSLLNLIAKTQPANAALLVLALQEDAGSIPDTHPKVKEKLSLWIAMLQTTIAKQPQ